MSGSLSSHDHDDTEKVAMSSVEQKPHPSELLEFATVSPTLGSGPRLQFNTHHEEIKPGPEVESGTTLNPTSSNDDLYEGMQRAIPNLRRLSVEARAATKAEHKMTFISGVRTYPKAIMWSFILSMTIVMEGYDLTLINSFFALPVFRHAYGTPLHPHAPKGHRDYQISPAWQSGLTNGAVAAEVVGLFFNGYLADRFGYHKTMVATLIWMCLFVFLAFFAFNIEMLLASQILCGLPWGIFQTLSTTYAAEVMPTVLRSYLTSNVNMCWLIGQILGVGIVRALVHNTSEWSYRIPFGLQWAFAFPILIIVIFAPESPWWLIRHEQPDEAKRSLLRLTSAKEREATGFNADETIAMMRHTNEVERYLMAKEAYKSGDESQQSKKARGQTSYLDCFRGPDLRRTEITCMVWATQALCGNVLTGYSAYFYEQAGFSTTNAFNLGVGMYGFAIFCGILAWFWMRRVGRRTLYLIGLAGSLIILLAGGIVASLPVTNGTSWALGSIVIVLTGVYDATIGPVCYVLVAEIPSSRLRIKTVVLARILYNIVGLITNTITPRMLNPTAWNWGGKTCYFYAGTTALCLLWCWFRLPDPFGLTYLELDILFEKRAKARKFREFQVNLASTGYFSLSRSDGGRGSTWGGYS